MNGSVFKRGSTWTYVVDVDRDARGRRRQRKRGGFATKREAERALRDLIRSLDLNAYVEPSQKTLGQYLTRDWLPAMQPPKLRDTTWTEYRRKVVDHVVPQLGELPLQRLTPTQLNAHYASLLASGRKDGRGGLAPKTVREVHVIIRKALHDAVRWGLLERNVAAMADPPSQRTTSAARRRRMTTWTEAELLRFLEHTRGDRLYPAWLLVATTGIRRSELAGLRWIDTDLEVGRIAVRQRLASVNGVPQFSEPKSGRSGRVIDLDRRTVEALRELRRLHDEERRLFGEVYQTEFGLVLCREDGRYVHPDYVSTLFQKAVEEAGVPRIRFHDLRHTHATLMLKHGVNPKIVSERLGHHSVAFTLDTYAHVTPGMQSAAAQLVADAVFGAAPTATSKMTERDGDQGRDQPVRDWLQREL